MAADVRYDIGPSAVVADVLLCYRRVYLVSCVISGVCVCRHV